MSFEQVASHKLCLHCHLSFPTQFFRKGKEQLITQRIHIKIREKVVDVDVITNDLIMGQLLTLNKVRVYLRWIEMLVDWLYWNKVSLIMDQPV